MAVASSRVGQSEGSFNGPRRSPTITTSAGERTVEVTAAVAVAVARVAVTVGPDDRGPDDHRRPVVARAVDARQRGGAKAVVAAGIGAVAQAGTEAVAEAIAVAAAEAVAEAIA